jgi:hypothetical protein
VTGRVEWLVSLSLGVGVVTEYLGVVLTSDVDIGWDVRSLWVALFWAARFWVARFWVAAVLMVTGVEDVTDVDGARSALFINIRQR